MRDPVLAVEVSVPSTHQSKEELPTCRAGGGDRFYVRMMRAGARTDRDALCTERTRARRRERTRTPTQQNPPKRREPGGIAGGTHTLRITSQAHKTALAPQLSPRPGHTDAAASSSRE